MGYVYSGQGADGSLIAMPSARSAVCVGPMARLAGACWNVFKICVNINIGRAQGVSKQGREQGREQGMEGGRKQASEQASEQGRQGENAGGRGRASI